MQGILGVKKTSTYFKLELRAALEGAPPAALEVTFPKD
jgi:hypothetical protein